MKKTLLVLVVAIIAISCSKSDDVTNKGKLDPNAMISIWGKARPTKTTSQGTLTPTQVVEQATVISSFIKRLQTIGQRGFNDTQRDVANVRLLWFGTDVISAEGTLQLDFIEGNDFVLQKWTNVYYENGSFNYVIKDTIAYIPNSVVRSAETAIKQAFADGNFTECYRIFNESFIFYPITGEEYRGLKSQGLN